MADNTGANYVYTSETGLAMPVEVHKTWFGSSVFHYGEWAEAVRVNP